MKYYSADDIVSFALSFGETTSTSVLATWADANANDPVYELEELEEKRLKFDLVSMLASKWSGDPESVKTAAEGLYEYITSTTPAGSGETVTRITTLDYTVLVANGMLQNLIYEYAGGNGDLILPTGADADGLTLYISNMTAGDLTYSEPVYDSTLTSSAELPPATHVKLVYNHADNRWYNIFN